MDGLVSGVVSTVVVLALIAGPFVVLALSALAFGTDSRRSADDRLSTADWS